MISSHVLIGFLLWIFVSIGQASEKQNITFSFKNGQTPAEINDLIVISNDSLSNAAVESLISKVSEISERYKKNVDGTVAEIYQMLNSDKTMPRLTRGEIIEILENLTKTNPDDLKKLVNKTRQDYQRALMLVMPYTSKNTHNFNIEELYTKPPVTHIIGTDIGKSTPERTSPKSNYFPKKNIDYFGGTEPSTYRPTFKKPKPIKQDQEKFEVNIPYYTLEPKLKKPTKQEFKFTTTKPQRFSNHRYPEEITTSPIQEINIIPVPTVATKPDPIHADYWHILQDNKPVVVKEDKPQTIIRPNSMKSSVYKSTILPKVTDDSTHSTTLTPSTTITATSTTQFSLDEIGVSDKIKDAMKEVNFSQKFSSQYDAASVSFPKQESTTTVRDVLDSIGTLQNNHSTVIPDVADVVDNLSPDMRELLMNFGLIEDPNQKSTNSVNSTVPPEPEEASIKPDSYTQFKPLPDSAPTRDDMEEFLASFGLIDDSPRSAKDLRIPKMTMPTHLTKVPDFNIEMIPESMHIVLEDIGLSEKKGRKLSLEEQKVNTDNTHIFKPKNTNVSEGEIKRLNLLLETIKRLEKLNRTATVDDLKDLDLENIRELTKILKKDATLPLDQQNFGPNPLDFDVGGERNEVKRQQSTTTTTTEEPKNPPLAALEESFGGPSTSGTDTTTEASLPPPRKTGFYYLLDWNSFLEVGEEGKNKVNIRFSPSAGDPSRFLRVTVP